MRLVYGLCLFLLLLTLGAIRRHLPATLAGLVMRIELPLAIHIRWRGGGMNDAVQTYIGANGAAYGPALAEGLFTDPSGSTEARMLWVPLIPFLTSEAIRARVREYAAVCTEPKFRREIESALEESKKW